ncbi:Asp-tRNA(Asn)/Glu-tRNA(Gln) amidotransferase subunit GatC [Hydrogenobacter hydrogenophilus]|uniref:Aspartyl/glutamyl-tRNA(Asn/Gln) amidotransferase subunit C n=1 Tax=Hydrogenobacter hydrogenophilus TaxID=35835 RepID=A0A285NU55_9AQUI|nr:Asp-tRNA(Asn)/Glu-tRNA(Gln) amidotransferase subunit GatC [Hydrogenobacter hydrogenophilus]SNZ11201.1 aspartyl/glutamyl-tRNA(Asn/Gln) amidotransferase subunit C [Hydrogenobacter hydrogenophilus]
MVDIKTVEKTAHLARIQLKEEEKEVLGKQFLDILAFVEQLQEVNTEGIEPYQHSMCTPMREDLPGECLSQEDAVFNAPQKEKGFFVVPRVVEV